MNTAQLIEESQALGLKAARVPAGCTTFQVERAGVLLLTSTRELQRLRQQLAVLNAQLNDLCAELGAATKPSSPNAITTWPHQG